MCQLFWLCSESDGNQNEVFRSLVSFSVQMMFQIKGHNDDTMPASYNLKMALGIFQNQSMIIHREHFWFHPKVLIIKRIGRNLQKTII